MITIEVDEVDLKQDWLAIKAALQDLDTIDQKYGGLLGQSLTNIKSKFKTALQAKIEADIMADFRSQLGI